jgi:copper oxidase (laccase) domain-containing protein
MSLFVAVSTTADGNMLIASDQTNPEVIQNRTDWLALKNISIRDTTRVRVRYIGDDYRRYHVVTSTEKGDGMLNGDVVTSDALVTRESNHALFLPIADCIGATVYDPAKHVLMLSHLGRHNLEQNGGYESIKFLIDTYGCDPVELMVTLTPAAGIEGYPLYAFDNRSLKDVALSQLQSAGILTKNIADDTTETTKDQRYFSHSEFLKGSRVDDGRHAVVAYLTD